MTRLLSTLLLFLLASTLLHAQSRWYKPENLNGLYGIPALTVDRAGSVWCIAANYNPSNTRYTVQRLGGDLWEEVSLPSYGYSLDRSVALRDIACDSSGRIIVATNQVLAVFDPSTERWTTRVFIDPDTIEYERVREFHRLVVDPSGVVWTTGQEIVIYSTDTVSGVPISSVSWSNEVFSFDHDTLRRHYTHTALDSTFFMPGVDMAAPVATGTGGVFACFQRTDSVAPSLLSVSHDTVLQSPLALDCPATISRWVTAFARLGTGELVVGTRYDDFQSHSNVRPAFVTTISPDLQRWSRTQLPHYFDPQALLDVGGTVLVGGRGICSLPDTAAFDYAGYAGVPAGTASISTVRDLLFHDGALWIATGNGVVVVDSIEEKLRSHSSVLLAAEQESSLSAYPNPVRAAEPLHINLPLHAGERIERTAVVDALGHAVPHIPIIEGEKITLHNVQSGAGNYLLSIRLNSGRTLTAQFSVAR